MAGKGNAANNGSHLEQLVKTTQALRGYVELDAKQRQTLRNHGVAACQTVADGNAFFARNIEVSGVTSIYGVEWKLDLFLWHPTRAARGLVLECKWQQVAGSADDKLPFSVLSLDHIKHTCGVSVAALMLDAAGARDVVKTWVRRECAVRGIEYFDQGSAWAKWASANL